MKTLLVCLFVTLSTGLHAANVMFYEKNDPGKDMIIIRGDQIIQYHYDVERSRLILMYSFGEGPVKADFTVETKERALEIVNKLLDHSDISLLELQRHY